MLRPYLRRRAPGDTGDDRHRVARLHRRLALRELPDVPVVHVDVYKAAEPTVRGIEVRLQRCVLAGEPIEQDRKSTRLNSSHSQISYAVFCLKKKKNIHTHNHILLSDIDRCLSLDTNTPHTVTYLTLSHINMYRYCINFLCPSPTCFIF